jgi:GH18 family chitinase
MNKRNSAFLLHAALAGLALLWACASSEAQPKVVAYVPNWVDLDALSQKIDYAKLTHINIAFENPENTNGDLSFSTNDDVLIAKAHANHVKILMSIGGGSASGDKVLLARYFDLISDSKRAGFVAKLCDYVVRHDLDGLDVDIEGPSINKDYGAFIRDLDKPLKGKKKLLTAALSRGYGGDKVPDSVFQHLDLVNIMAYDGTGYWDPKMPGQHSSFEFTTNNVLYWLARGLPRSKAVLGVPFYGYGFGKAFRKGDYGYSKILAAYPGAEKRDEVGETIYYNGIPTIKAKSRYVVEQGLAGVMIWSLDYDVQDERSLLSAIHEGLTATAVSSRDKP